MDTMNIWKRFLGLNKHKGKGFNKHRRPTKCIGYATTGLRYALVVWTLYFSHFLTSFFKGFAEFVHVYVQKYVI